MLLSDVIRKLAYFRNINQADINIETTDLNLLNPLACAHNP